MQSFLDTWGKASLTSLGFFWMALWAFCLGYAISSMIQVFVTRERMQRTMGTSGPRSVGLGTFFGFVSSSCSFAALSTTRALFEKGAGLVPALAFLLASTNLVVELGIVIFIFLGWQFVVGEYVGGVLLILIMWLVVRLTLSKKLEAHAREKASQAGGAHDHGEGGGEGEAPPSPMEKARSWPGWRQVASQYRMEWQMVWKDVTIGFTIAGIISAFVPAEFFQWLFIGSGSENGPSWWQLALHTVIGPVAAFFTFIGSMGNIPLAAVLFSSGVSFAGVMAFIFSDLVVLPMLRISASYFGWKMAAYILVVFLVCLVATALLLQAGFSLAGILPDPESAKAARTGPGERFQLDYTLWLNAVFLLLSGAAAWLLLTGRGGSEHGGHGGHDHGGPSLTDRILRPIAVASYLWLLGGVLVWLLA